MQNSVSKAQPTTSQLCYYKINMCLCRFCNDILFAPGEMGQDAGGVTRDLLVTYWHHMLQQWFHGERVKVPCVPASKVADAETVFLAAGRVLMHGLLLTRSIPCETSIAFLMSALHCILRGLADCRTPDICVTVRGSDTQERTVNYR